MVDTRGVLVRVGARTGTSCSAPQDAICFNDPWSSVSFPGAGGFRNLMGSAGHLIGTREGPCYTLSGPVSALNGDRFEPTAPADGNTKLRIESESNYMLHYIHAIPPPRATTVCTYILASSGH